MNKEDLGLELNNNSVNIETTPEYVDMDKLSLSAPVEFLSKYNSPKEWILDQDEAERVKVFTQPANREVGTLEKIEYGLGNVGYNVGRAVPEITQLGLGLASGVEKTIFPNSTETALDRLYKDVAISNAKNRERRENIVAGFTGGDSSIVKWSDAIGELGLFLGTAGVGAGIGANVARRGIQKLATETAKGVATSPSVVRRAASVAATRGARKGQIAATLGTTFTQEGGSSAVDKVRQYIEETGDTELKNYNPTADTLTALSVGAINSVIEVGFGVERFIPEFWGTGTNFNRAARRFVEGALGEGVEEFAQDLTSQIGDIVNGYREDIDWGQAWDNAIVGGVLGGAAGSTMYYLNRRRMARKISNDYGIDYKKAASIVDDMLGTGIERTTNELSAQTELATEQGQAWDKLVNGVKTAMETVDFADETSRNNQATAFAKTNVPIAMRLARKSGLSTDEFLDVAEFGTMNNGQNLNMVFIKPLGTVADIDKRIAAQDEIIERQKELRKTGAGDNNVLNRAKQRKAILQKAKAIKQYNDKQYKEQLKAQTTPELAKEIETATKDAEVVKELPTQADFGSKVESENLTSAEKSRRYGNAVLKRLLPSKSDFDAVMVDPMYANAKQAIIAVADRINSFIKAHRTYSLKTDIANALKKMQTVNQGNFIDSVTTPDLDGVDVIAENAFLYHFLFSDATTIQTYLDSYITRAEDSLNQKKGKLSKKDLVGQSFKATDNAMQTQAQVIGAEYTSIYNEDGSYADKNVMAVMLSYQNQFVQEQPKTQAQTNIEMYDAEIQPISESIIKDAKKMADKNGYIFDKELNKKHQEVQDWLKGINTDNFIDSVFGKYNINETLLNWLNDNPKVKYLDDIREEKDRAWYTLDKDGLVVGDWRVGQAFLKSEKAQDMSEYKNDYDEGNIEIYVYKVPANQEELIDNLFNYYVERYNEDLEVNENMQGAPLENVDIYSQKPVQDLLFQEQFDLADENTRLDDIYPAYDGETIEVDGKERTVYNSNGDRIAKSKEALTNFWRWFGDSKVVDEQGRPLVVYHGSNMEFDTFDKNKGGFTTEAESALYGFYFTSSAGIAESYANIARPEKIKQLEKEYQRLEKIAQKTGKASDWDAYQKVYAQYEELELNYEPTEKIYNVYLKIENPMEYDFAGKHWEENKYLEVLLEATNKGNDGVIFRNSIDDPVGTRISDIFVAFEPNQIKSVDNRGTYSADTGNIYFQEEPTDKKELVVTHGITLDKLNKALELGGLPVPSIAISRINEPLENFGDIKLIGTKNIINPELSKSNLVYDRDVWTRRFPRPEYKNAKLSEVRKFRDKFKEYFIRTDDESVLYGSITDPMVNSKYPAQAIENFQDSKGAKLYYIENVLGDKVDVPKYDRATKMFENLTLFVKPDTKFVEEVAQIDPNIDNIDKLRNKIEKPIRDLINRFDFEKEYPKYAEKMKQEAEDYYFGEKFKGSDILSLIRSAKEYLRLLENENSRYGVDRFELEKILDKYKLYDNNDYMKWSEKQITDLLGEPKVRVGNKLMPWTLENITAAMIKGKTVAVETTGVEVGKIIASGATKFSSLESIREKGKELKTKTESEAQTDQLGADMYQFASDIISVADLSDNFSNIDMVLLSLQEGVSKSNITEDGLENLLNKNLDILAKYPRNILKRGVDLIKQTKRIVRYYFEAKPQRAVSLNEFIGAVIPEDSRYDEISNKLKERGFYVARTKNLQEGISIIENQTPVLFQSKKANGFYDPELGVIVLGRNMNEMTLPHEMQHYWLDKIFSIYKRAKSGELKVRDEWMTETKALFDMLGIDENQTRLTEGQQEKFARMSEAYLTGMGVSGDMNATFKEYQHWIPEKYKSMMNLAYKDDNGKIVLPYLDQAAVDFFNKWYANYSLPSLATSPERQEFINPEDENGEVLPVSIKEMNNRDKEFGVDAEEQVKTDQRLYNTLDENMPAEIKIESDGQKVVQESRSNFLKESEKQQRRWFERKSRDTEAQLAQDYIEKNPEHAKEVVYGDPELVPNDTGIDRATLINAYMALNKITPESEDWATLQTNIAINQSLAGTQLALSNNTSYRTYLDALREIEDAREMKVATNYAGAKQGAVERFNRDIQRFVDQELPKVLATAPNSQAREIALKSLFEMARTKFSGNTTGDFLNQMDLDFAKAQKGASAAFTRWAINQIKKDAGAKLNNQEQAKLLEISAKAQQAVTDLDDRNIGKAVAGAVAIREWQVEKDKLSGVSPEKFSLFGDWAPRAMLASFNTLVVSNIPSTAMNTLVVRMLESGVFGENNVSKSLTDSEIKRIKAIYGASAMNLAQMEKPTSPSLLHGEKYSSSGQKWYDPFTILGKEDNWFRVPTFVNTLARIATQDAKTTGRDADEVFKEYCRLENQSDEAKLARKQALAVSNMAVFTQDGGLARALNGIRDWLNKGSRTLIGLDPKGFGLGNLLSPFLKTGANIAEMGIRGSIAPITTISALAQSWRSGKAIDPMKKLALKMDWTYFALSSLAVALLSALTSDDDEFYTDPYETGKAYDPNKPYDSINIAGVWIDLDFFGVFAIPIRTGCKLVKQWKTDNLSAIYKGYGQGLKYAAMDTPLLQEIFNNQISYATKKTEDWATGLAYNQVNKFVPSQIKPLSRAISRGTGTELDISGAGKIIERKFHRNYGFDAQELTTQDLIDIFTTKITYQE